MDCGKKGRVFGQVVEFVGVFVEVEELGVDAGKLVLSPTRTYAPVIARMLKEARQ